MKQNGKIKTIPELVAVIDDLRRSGKKIVQCHGIYDLLHYGHVRHFERARELGDVLIVTISPDSNFPDAQSRAAFGQGLRAEAVASLSVVDYVGIIAGSSLEDALRTVRPDVYVKGAEFRDDSSAEWRREEATARETGARIAFTDDVLFTSGNLINRYLSNLPKEIEQYIELFQRRHTVDDMLAIVDNMANLKVLVIGDAIIDDYQFCQPIGMSSKDPALALKYQSHDLFAGGALAVANHVANFADQVCVVTVLGEIESYESLIRSRLATNVDAHFVVKPKAPTTVKRRFVDGYSFSKLLELYIIDDSNLPDELDSRLAAWLESELPKYDLVIAADFGHGAISRSTADILVRRARFSAVNAQANAANRGLHTITRYPHADYVCIAEHEARLETRDASGAIRPMIEALGRKLDAKFFVITRGRMGCAVWGEPNGFTEVPPFAQKVVDRVGAGDAFLAVTALAAVQDVPIECLGFLGNTVGALAVEILGNQKSIDQTSVKNLITSLIGSTARTGSLAESWASGR